MPLWLIRELTGLSLLAPLIYKIIHTPFSVITISFIIIVLGGNGIVSYRSFLYWMPVYMMGALSSRMNFDNILVMLKNRDIVVESGVIVLLYLIFSCFLPNGISKEDMTILENFIFILFRLITPIVLIPIVWLIYKLNVHDRKWMHYSFFVYCMHAPVIAILKIVLDKVLGQGGNVELIKYFMIVIFTYSLCVLLAMGLQKYFRPLWMVLNGNRH